MEKKIPYPAELRMAYAALVLEAGRDRCLDDEENAFPPFVRHRLLTALEWARDPAALIGLFFFAPMNAKKVIIRRIHHCWRRSSVA